MRCAGPRRIVSVIAQCCGLDAMPIRKSSLFTAIGSAAWDGILVAEGWAGGGVRSESSPLLPDSSLCWLHADVRWSIC